MKADTDAVDAILDETEHHMDAHHDAIHQWRQHMKDYMESLELQLSAVDAVLEVLSELRKGKKP